MAIHQALTGTPARACDLSPVIHNSFTPEFLEALIGIAKGKKEVFKANPVHTGDTCWSLQMAFDNRRVAMERVSCVIQRATMLTEPEHFDLLDLEIASSELEACLDEDMGQMGRDAHFVVRRAA